MAESAHASLRHGAVLLAAGASRRLGRPKQTVLIDGEPLVARMAGLALGTDPRALVVSLGAHADAVRGALGDQGDDPRVHCVMAADWALGMGASLRVGLDALPDGCDAALVLLCDQPAMNLLHLQRLLAAWRAHPEHASASAYAGVLGVPAVLPRAWWPALGSGADRGARDLLRARVAEVSAVTAAELARDLDTPADLDHLP